MNIRDYFSDRFEVAKARNNNIRLLDCDCPWCGKGGKVYIKLENWGVGLCHKCGQSFRGVEFVAEYESCTPNEAFRILKGEEVEVWEYEKDKKPESITLEPFFPELIPLNDQGRKYLIDRGINDAMIKQYAFMSCEKNSFYDGSLVWSRDRIIIPIFDRDGKLTSWQGRALDPESEVKYLFSPDFKKSQHLYNSWNIKKDPSYLIVSEGVFDTLGWIKNGFTNTVASFGKKISKMQVELIRLINPTFLFLALDYDCVFEMISFIEEYGHLFGNCRVIKLPVGRDSDECSKLELLQSFKSAKAPTWADKVLSRA